MSVIDARTASAEVDWAAHQHNLGAIADLVAPSIVMAVVKADGYGHGLLAAAVSARAAGVSWLGVAVAGEALALRAAGDTGRLMCWLYGPAEDFTALIAAQVDLSASSIAELERISGAAEDAGVTARVHLKIDTGLSRNGCSVTEWDELCRLAADDARVEVVGVWTHMATAEDPTHASVREQLIAFDAAYAAARSRGLTPVRHAANSAAALVLPQARYEMVRVGIASYGVDPDTGVAAQAGVELEPVMTVRAGLVSVKKLPAGQGVSYGHTWIADRDTVIGLVPLGYADGLMRLAGNRTSVTVNGRRVPIVGRVCMDQCVVDLGPDSTDQVGDEVIIFGRDGQSANQFAADCDTIGYEIVTRIGPRVQRIPRP